MSDVPDWVRWSYILLAPLVFLGLAVIQFLENSPRASAVMVITCLLTLPNIHRFWKEIQMGQEIDDERFTQVVRKAGLIAFFTTMLTTIIVGGIAAVNRIGSKPGFFTIYDDLITALVGATVFTGAQVWYNHVGTQRNLTKILLGDKDE